MKRTTGLALVAVAASLAMALSACSGGSTAPAASGSSGAAEPRTFTIWHYEGDDSAMGQAWAKAVDLFKAKHPEVTVNVEKQTFEQIQKNAKSCSPVTPCPTSWSTTRATPRRASSQRRA